VPGEVAHPLQRRTHAQGANDHAQVAGNGALQRQDVDGPLVQAVLQEVDPRVRGNNVLGEVHVRHFKGSGRFVHRFADQAGDLHQLVTHLGELFLKNLTHVGVLSLELRRPVSGQQESCRRSALQPATLPPPGERLSPCR
jgi:hypothetical protein